MIAVMIAGAVATLVSLFVTRFLIVFFRTRGHGQPILGKEDHGPEHHMVKQGTPTMGGIAIVVAAFVGWVGRPRAQHRVLRPGHDRVGRYPRHVVHGLPRRLDQGPQAPQPRHLLEAEELRHDADELRPRVVAGRHHGHRRIDLARPRRRPGLRGAACCLGHLGRPDHLGDHQRRQRDRRPRRPRRRIGPDGVRCVHDHRLLGVPQPRRSVRGRRQPARPGRARCGVRRCVHGLPVVERGTGADHHG